jgi:hydrogenase expression/formation protein HypD
MKLGRPSVPSLLPEDPALLETLARRIREAAARLPEGATIMEVCGTHTHAIADAGIRSLLPPSIRLVSGPGCPVCVTPVGYLDRAIALGQLDGTIICTFGDLLRVPASSGTLESLRASRGNVQVIYSPQDALNIARERPDARVVLLSVGFETTTPGIASSILQAEREGVANFLVLAGNKLVPPALRALLTSPDTRIDGFILPGHVSVIIGEEAYRFLVDEFGVPGVIVGFEPTDILLGIGELLRLVADGQSAVRNLYSRVVRPEGNPRARDLMGRVFAPCDTEWRGLGWIPGSGLRLREELSHRDAGRIPVELPQPREPKGCRCGDVLRGAIAPPDCPLFGDPCTPEAPLGACMVSSEGACAAWYRQGAERVRR